MSENDEVRRNLVPGTKKGNVEILTGSQRAEGLRRWGRSIGYGENDTLGFSTNC